MMGLKYFNISTTFEKIDLVSNEKENKKSPLIKIQKHAG